MAAVGLRDFAGMSAEEEAVYVAVESSPGVPARDLGKALHRNTAAVLNVVQSLVDRGFVERRALNRVRTDGREHTYNGLFVVPVPVGAVTPQGRPDGVTEKSEAATVPQASGIGSTPPPVRVAPLMGASMTRRMGKAAIMPAMETLPTSTVAMAPPELDPARTQLRELGKRLGWGRLPLSQGETRGGAFLPGRAVAAGEEAWWRALEELSDEDVEVALSAGRRLVALLGIAALVEV